MLGQDPRLEDVTQDPAETVEEYDANVREGLEEYSERRWLKLAGISRAEAWRWKQMAAIPDELFERLLASDIKVSTKSLAAVGHALNGGAQSPEIERCPHCGEVLRVRSRWTEETRKIVNQWLSEQNPEAGDRPTESR